MNSFLEEVNTLQQGHPVKVYYEESALIQDLLLDLATIAVTEDFEAYFNRFNELATIEKRFVRKENQLFPYLEKHGWNGPSQNMWSFHDVLRDQIRILHQHNTQRNYSKIQENLGYLIEGIKRLLIIEDIKLFPTAMKLLTDEEWQEFYEGDLEIGWMLRQNPSGYKLKEAYVHPSEDFSTRKLDFNLDQAIKLDEGFLLPEQLNLMLQFLPVDLTYVDENDKVLFYNRGDTRVFPRSKGIIGREVKFCHPPKSVHMVLRILEEFKAGTKDTAEFWINYREQMIHIRYFAIRDKERNYKGVVEMSQDVTEIRKLEGEQRLLDWD